MASVTSSNQLCASPSPLAESPQHAAPQVSSTTPLPPTSPTPVLTATRPNTRTFTVSGTTFEIDLKYQLLRPIGHGAYGIVMYVCLTHCTKLILSLLTVMYCLVLLKIMRRRTK